MRKDNIEKKDSQSENISFPWLTLDSAVKIIQEASKYGGPSFKKEIFAGFNSRGAKGTGSPTCGAFIRRTGSMRDLGLLKTREDKLELTDLAHQILYPSSKEEKEKAVTCAFLSPKLFQELYHSINKNTPLERGGLVNRVIREYKISSKRAAKLISCFLNSAEFAGLLEYGDKDESLIILKEVTNKYHMTQISEKKEEKVERKKVVGETKVERKIEKEEKTREVLERGKKEWSITINKKNIEGKYVPYRKNIMEMTTEEMLDYFFEPVSSLKKKVESK
ncbi:hypothetical protein COY23_02625 [bacterium (Candidatus Torokbacteria) CG_4_10_14_0_2_um_filter_35_8]|nr:MAG: hypothetical protein COY23_02625 [bacterium (Candidatus Torokbacteria) CG_4_10_14_0_2_um_filter_35_8]